jgi:hypothetical protein
MAGEGELAGGKIGNALHGDGAALQLLVDIGELGQFINR